MNAYRGVDFIGLIDMRRNKIIISISNSRKLRKWRDRRLLRQTQDSVYVLFSLIQ